jgi:trimethylamine corrinoid protein
MSKDEILERLRQAIVEGDLDRTQEACAAALEAQIGSNEILNDGMTLAMQIVGQKWDCREYFLPEVLAAAEAMKLGIDYLKPHLSAERGGPAGVMVIGTVKGDIHSIGKNIVALFMELAGFEVYNLGEDVPAERFVEAVREHHGDVVGSSAFITTPAAEMARIEELLRAAGLRDQVFTMVGGAVLDPEWATKIGADAFGRDALHAIQLAQEFMTKKKARVKEATVS